MSNVYIMRGYSGSGKSTRARELATTTGALIVSRDNIRAMLTGKQEKQVLDQAGEALVTKIEESAIASALRSGQSVIVDDTNLRLKFARRWADIAVREGATYEVVDVEASLVTCIERNSLRHAREAVPAHVISTQASKFAMPWPTVVASTETAHSFKPYVPDTSKPRAYGFDLDGTLAHNLSGRDWYDPTQYHRDTPNDTLLRVLRELDKAGYVIVIFSGRSEDHRADVENWLMRHDIPFDILVMRKSGDQRNDGIVKSELFDEFIAPYYNFLAQFDDRSRVVHALRAKNITVYQVAEGSF